MAKVSPFQFLQEVRQEASKVTWPTRRETITTSIIVVLMAVTASMFFLAADQIISRAIGALLSLGH
jgi:preprotein translocase subunit SecE